MIENDFIDHDKIFKTNMSKLLYMQLSIEGYELDTKDEFPLMIEAYKEISHIREMKNILPKHELVVLSENAINKFQKVIDVIGREKITFYEDGTIEYKWPAKGGLKWVMIKTITKHEDMQVITLMMKKMKI